MPRERVQTISIFLGIVLGLYGLTLALPKSKTRYSNPNSPKANYFNAVASGSSDYLAPWMLTGSGVAFVIAYMARQK